MNGENWSEAGARIPVPSGWKWSKKNLICPNPNCRYSGAAIEQPRGSRAAMWLLMCFLLLPGLIYGMVFSGQQYCCPKCRTKIDLA
jgi:hypothetical protein